MSLFNLRSDYSPTGDQPRAIETLLSSLQSGNAHQTLLGVTGSGKTFTMANIIATLERPALVLAHNKTLTAQLAQEFKEFFPDNAVHYFVSYYDYYQPEAYIQKTDTYIEKESTINAEIDRLRHATTESLLSRRDVIIVASVSCIYGIGDPRDYESQIIRLSAGERVRLETLISQLVAVQFERSSTDFDPGMFRILGDTIDIFPRSREEYYSIEFFGDEIERIVRKEPITNRLIAEESMIAIFPAKHFVTTEATVADVVPQIRAEMEERIKHFTDAGDLLRAERIKTRVEYDLEMLSEVGYVNGIENYSRFFARRSAGEAPSTLLDFFPKDFLTFIDESHITIPQVGGMYAGDHARKESLIENGFRLPSAFDNRPLKFDEFESRLGQRIYVSATPADYELGKSEAIAEQVIRPTGLLDPEIEIADMEYMVDDLMGRMRTVIGRGERILVTTITKKSSEELSEYFASNGLKVRYLHSEIETVERLEILRDLREGIIDIIVGVNLLREGLDLPEVSLIAIIDAEKIGFLRSTRSLLQIIGRAARNSNGRVIMYSSRDPETSLPKISQAMHEAIGETNRRREIQQAYNAKHGVTPTTVVSRIKSLDLPSKKKSYETPELKGKGRDKLLKRLELEMDVAAANLEFERAAELRDEILALTRDTE
ncbi:MAG TPA: excinuclease ABC subunit UvrB [bacterium]|nr:excinuclease ABC subunit UvrB [bacterium]